MSFKKFRKKFKKALTKTVLPRLLPGVGGGVALAAIQAASAARKKKRRLPPPPPAVDPGVGIPAVPTTTAAVQMEAPGLQPVQQHPSYSPAPFWAGPPVAGYQYPVPVPPAAPATPIVPEYRYSAPPMQVVEPAPVFQAPVTDPMQVYQATGLQPPEYIPPELSAPGPIDFGPVPESGEFLQDRVPSRVNDERREL